MARMVTPPVSASKHERMTDGYRSNDQITAHDGRNHRFLLERGDSSYRPRGTAVQGTGEAQRG